MSRSIILLGGPDSGKTNYIGRLWRALDAETGALHAAEQPEDINFVLEVTDHLFEGGFAPRSEHSDVRRDFEVVVAATKNGPKSKVVVPDISGELWRNAVIEGEIDPDWMSELRQADAALLFVRVDSDQDVRPLDWVTSRKMLEKLGDEEDQGLPTQVMLCELIRFLEISLTKREDGELPRLSVVVTAWDLVDAGKFDQGPAAYLEREYPLVAGRLNAAGWLIQSLLHARRQPVSMLIAALFPVVYQELAKADDVPDFLKFVPFFDWDRCKTARRELVNAFMSSSWKAGDLALVACRTHDIAKILKRVAASYGGEEYLTRIESDLDRLNEDDRRQVKRTIDEIRSERSYKFDW
ncbi:hypothetical protein [Burkholderia sp. IMCC1007]|uniref:TRAFAC clade GTPase domain-containing protein n=1 Tax=Burkholderia sp. IMCC1007 TaxID=3004104 RepID=UPI0022B53045|nr:hypothetical protein [Burkholderia sp. IMCC1007]